ncbi:hypothetical protein A2590_01975, partial [Candidatus Adlerbacteria bacterium RIFOXYD1_FULL_48_8]
ELHHAEYSHYDTLHKEMADRGLIRTIVSDSGTRYHLPWAEYNYIGDASRNSILQKTKDSVGVTGKSAAILVTESKGRAWEGLEKVL